MGKGSVGQATGGEVPVPWIPVGRTRVFPFLVFPNKSSDQMPDSLSMDFVSRQFVRVIDDYRPTLTRCFDARAPTVGAGDVFGLYCFHAASWFVVQITPRTISTDGHPCGHRPSGSTTQPSEQHAGAVASKFAL